MEQNQNQNIRFIDLETGNTFDGSSPYVFWLDGEQSINLIYSKPICFISNQQSIEVSIKKNSIFSLIDPSNILNGNLEDIYGFQYHDIKSLKTNSLTSTGVKHHNYYIHIIYIVGSSKHNGEYIEKFFIGGEDYQIGGDFYGGDETLYINLSNNGVEIPPAIQKAIYDVNIREEQIDNITINRKWKELLSNYWDIVANKGSYKSLYNSLKWFEYNDKVRLCEIWKDSDDRYFINDIQALLSDKYVDNLDNFFKTTYCALYYALEEPKKLNGEIVLDREKNPELIRTVSKWSTQDMALKMSLLGNFYEAYFMPIHLDLIHSTIENVVYSSPFEARIGSLMNRRDFVYNCQYIDCGVQNGDVYKLDLVKCYVTKDTLFGLSGEQFNQIGTMIGVQKEPAQKPMSVVVNGVEYVDVEQLSQYTSQLYDNIGAIVDFNIPLPQGITIKREVLVFKTYDIQNSRWIEKTLREYKLFNGEINFHLFCPIEGDYEVKILLEDLSGTLYTCHRTFQIADLKNAQIDIYKVKNLKVLGNHAFPGQASQMNDYIFARTPILGENANIKQFVKASIEDPMESGWEGVCLNHVFVSTQNMDLNDYYKLERLMGVNSQGMSDVIYIYISKKYGKCKEYDDLNDSKKASIQIDDYMFIPEFHKLEMLVWDDDLTIDKYIITDDDTLCIKPNLSFGKYISDYDWEFVNVSKPNSTPIKLKYIKEPFIANTVKMPLEPGFYNIIFRYRLTNEDKVNEIVLNSAFIKV